MVVEEILKVATFDIVENADAFGWMLDFPEEDEGLLSSKYMDSGYESSYMINLLGVGFIIIVFLFLVMFLLLITLPLRKCFVIVQT